MAPVSVVTGANRGIGLALCRKLKSNGYQVIGACRKKSPELESLGVKIVEGVDVGVDGGCAPLSKVESRVDLLVCNAGILREDSLEDIDMAVLREQFEVNSLGPLRTYLALQDKLADNAKVCIVTSRMGSIEDNGSGGDYGYRMSKAAVNMAGKTLSVDLKKKGIAVGILHPGFVATDMTAKYHGMEGVISAEESAADLVKIIEEKLHMDTTGTFWHRNGSVLPW
ncbi:hypothetical protein CHLRE_16g675450v5 [Chlamydomonas reinhardtii]|uniref:Short-chain dehydrogenase n=1 Tax=Chlamydomonas reinhardtii TaxID=3055 RepID=A0A2K3CVF5_CHLRE|nr:uncharacterized protein CHLRE_16g675450v5 [Chlamydomonas reinhardtii]XP_042916108.1 uncharacterized protein CHLRE_16g675450v5 [Chlamydomonas reinhardtii]PNW72261.1 hypothetical protein CHLRE_16g675450v5 [Chlamydomonas reinhardtii]PNW72262.1 hypothetical protein CHLRE_16g675450v5 [Chlamydomonas reinhardtii]